jgi:hypothetical protein
MSRKVLYISIAISIVALILIAAKKHGTSAYYALPCCNWGTVKINEEFTVIQNLLLPAGSYVANASAVLAADNTSDVSVDCIFMLNSVIQGEAVRVTMGASFNNFASLPLTTAFTIDTPKELTVACRTTGTQVFSQPTSITAISVDSLTIQEGFQP